MQAVIKRVLKILGLWLIGGSEVLFNQSPRLRVISVLRVAPQAKRASGLKIIQPLEGLSVAHQLF